AAGKSAADIPDQPGDAGRNCPRAGRPEHFRGSEANRARDDPATATQFHRTNPFEHTFGRRHRAKYTGARGADPAACQWAAATVSSGHPAVSCRLFWWGEAPAEPIYRQRKQRSSAGASVHRATLRHRTDYALRLASQDSQATFSREN